MLPYLLEMSNFEFLRSVNEHFIDVSTEMDILDVVPEEGLSKVLDLESFESRGSGWIYVSWKILTIKILKWTPTSG